MPLSNCIVGGKDVVLFLYIKKANNIENYSIHLRLEYAAVQMDQPKYGKSLHIIQFFFVSNTIIGKKAALEKYVNSFLKTEQDQIQCGKAAGKRNIELKK